MKTKDNEDLEIIPKQNCFMINASRGTGNTFHLNSFISFLKLHLKNVIVVASSGIAATVLIYGATAHYTFKIPLDVTETSTRIIPIESKLAAKLLEDDVIIWEDIFMIHKDCIELLIGYPKTIFNTYVALVENSRDVWRLSSDCTSYTSVVESSNYSGLLRILRTVQVFHYTYTFRGHEAQSFAWIPKWQRRITKLPRISPQSRWEPCNMHKRWRWPNNDSTFDKTNKRVQVPDYQHFPWIRNMFQKMELLSSQVLLTLPNRRLPLINYVVRKRIPGEALTLLNADSVENKDENSLTYPTYFLSLFSSGSFPDNIMGLKKGFIVKHLRNIYTL